MSASVNFFGSKIFASASSRASGTFTTPMFGCTPAPYAPVCAFPFVTALKMVVLPLRWKPIMPMSMTVGYRRQHDHPTTMAPTDCVLRDANIRGESLSNGSQTRELVFT